MRPKHILRRILPETNLGAKHQVYVRARKVKLNLRMAKDFFSLLEFRTTERN